MSDDFDLRLAAWLDGSLSDDELAAFEADLARDPALAAKAAQWQANDAFIAGALGPIAEEPIDDALLAKLGLAAPAAPPLAPAPSAIASAPLAANDNAPWWRRHALPLGGAIAASLVAVLLIATPGAPQRDALSLALDSTPSLKQAKLADGRVIEPTVTVRAADGRWCREFRSGGDTSLACRGATSWKIEATATGSGPADGSEVGLAAGGDTGPLDASYRQIGASDPLGADEEASLIAKGWSQR